MRRGNLYISIYINLDPKKQTCFIFASTWTLFAPRSKCKAEHETVKSIWQLTRYHAGSSRQKEKMPALSFTDRLLCTKLRVQLPQTILCMVLKIVTMAVRTRGNALPCQKRIIWQHFARQIKEWLNESLQNSEVWQGSRLGITAMTTWLRQR